MAQPVYQTSPSSSYKFRHSILEYSTQAPHDSHQVNPLPKPHNMSRRERNTKHKASRLEMMRMDYRQKLLKEKEDKLNQYHTTHQERNGPHKTNSGGTVREFFAERRALEAQQNPSSLPPIQTHFNKVKEQRNQANPPQRQRGSSHQEILHSDSKANSSHNIQRRQPSQRRNYQQSNVQTEAISDRKAESTSRFVNQRNGYKGQKRTKGIDKQDPLPPLQKGSRRSGNKPPTPNKRYETYADLSKQNYDEVHAQVPTPPQEAKPLMKRPRAPSQAPSSDVDESESMSVCTDDAPPNLMRLKAKAQFQKQLSMKKLSTNKPPNKHEVSEFQKWQMEQDQAREQRLAQFKTKTQVQNASDTEDGHKSSDLAMREKELLEKIRNEQARLERLQNERQMLEEQEKQEAKAEEEWALKLVEGAKTTVKEEKFTPQPPVMKKKPAKQKSNPKKFEAQMDEGPRDEPLEEDTDGRVKNFYAEAAEQADHVEDIGQLSPCSVCGRSFASDRLARHEKVCAKNSKTKRKAFNSALQRAQGTDHEKYVVSGKYKEEPEKKAKKVDWRVQHKNFIKTIQYAKGASDEPPPPTENPEYVQCPHCTRKFNPHTAERHIPKCKDIRARPLPVKKK